MKKLFSVMIILFSIIWSSFAGGQAESTAAGTADEPIVLKWSNALSEKDADTIYYQKICDRIFEETNGKVKVVQYLNSALGGETESFQLLRAGSIAFMNSSIGGYLSRYHKPVEAMLLPFIFDDVDHINRFFEDPYVVDMFNSVIPAKTGIRTLAGACSGSRCLTTNKAIPTVPADMKGAKVRCMPSDAAAFMVSTLGAEPLPLDFSELYLGLQTGLVDGQENPPTLIIAKKFYEVQKNLILTKHSFNVTGLYISEKVFESLPVEYQETIDRIFKEEAKKISQEYIDSEAKDIERLRDEFGMNIFEPDRKAFYENAQKMIAEKYGDDAELKDVLAAIENAR